MSSGFISEATIVEARKHRQEEWERVRKPGDPAERPEEPYDPRSLFERLQEQKQKKDLEYEEAHKLKNMIKGLDDDEIEFLDLVDRTKLAADRKKEIEEELELNDYRNRVATLQEKSLEERLQAEIAANRPKAPTNRTSQQKLLKGVVVKKTEAQKRKMSDEIVENGDRRNGDQGAQGDNLNIKRNHIDGNNSNSTGETGNVDLPDTGMKCVGILPGLGCYNESSSEENSSDSEVEINPSRTDILGRKIVTVVAVPQKPKESS